jgi:hypothetical protein
MNVKLKYGFEHEGNRYKTGCVYDLENGLAAHLVNHGLAVNLGGSQTFINGEEVKTGERFKPNNPNFDAIIRSYRSPAQRQADKANADEYFRTNNLQRLGGA